MLLSFFEKMTRLRMNHSHIRPGGVAADLPDGWRDDVKVICEMIQIGWTSTTTSSSSGIHPTKSRSNKAHPVAALLTVTLRSAIHSTFLQIGLDLSPW